MRTIWLHSLSRPCKSRMFHVKQFCLTDQRIVLNHGTVEISGDKLFHVKQFDLLPQAVVQPFRKELENGASNENYAPLRVGERHWRLPLPALCV
jgi:hypothetical protein